MENKKNTDKTVKSKSVAKVAEYNVVEKEEIYTGFLRNELVIIQFIPKPTKEISDPKHVAYGGKLNGTFDNIVPPRLDKGKMQNILTKQEKDGLEFLMGRDLSIYGDYWRSYRKGGMFPIALGKDDVTLNLSVPEDYIKYKVLLNTNLVANSIEQFESEYRASYKYVMVKEDETSNQEENKANSRATAYMFYAEQSNSPDGLRYILRKLGKHTHARQDIKFLRGEVGKAIETERDRKLIVKLSEEKDLKEKILLEEAFTLGIIDRISDQYFTKEKDPICGTGVEPTEENAAKFLGSPVGQEMRLEIEARIKNARD